jgi:hypothetical protein
MKIRQTLLIIGILFSGIVFFTVENVFAQTDRITLEWNANSESDMYLYRVFKGTDASHLTKVDSIYHPETTVTDYHVKKGVQYYYGIRAVDFSLNASIMSDLLSVAIPKISGLPVSMELPADTTVNLSLDDYVVDPDNNYNELQWEVSGFSQVDVSFSRAPNTLTIKTPQNWSGTERGIIKVEDPDHLYDQVEITITSKFSSQPPVFTTIPQIETQEDTPVQVNLAAYIQDGDSPNDTLSFSVGQSDHLQLELKDSLLNITPDKDWYGEATVNVDVKDETGLIDSTSFKVVVHAVDDAPVLAKLPSIRMHQDTTATLDLDAYVWDVDNDLSELQWEFSNYSHVTVSFSQENHQLTIHSPHSWGGFEYIKVTVQDPDGKASFDTLIVHVEKVSYAPQLSAIPEIIFNEDQTYKINLNDYVNDPDTPLANLYWEVHGNDKIHYQIDYVNKAITLQADPDWFGSEKFRIKVIDPDQHADSTQVTVNVLPVNDPPEFKNFPAIDLSRINPRSIAYRSYLSDVDDAVNNLYLRILSAGTAQITIQDDHIIFQVAEDWYGSQTARLIVQDAAGASDTTNVVIYRQNLQTAPRIVNLDSLHLEEDGQRTLALGAHVSDPDNDADEIDWSIEAPSCLGAHLDANSRQLFIQPVANWNGQEWIVLKATDPQGHFDYDTLQVVVRPVNDPPEIRSIPNETMLAGTYFTMDLTQYLSDPDGYDDLQQVELLNNPHSFIGYYLNDFHATFFAPQGFHGQETFMVRATDKALAQAVGIFVLKVQSGTMAAGVDVHPFGSGTVIHLDWRSRMPTKDHLEYSLDWSFDKSTPQEAEFKTEHHVVLENLKPNKTYHFRVVSVDENGMVVTNHDSVFETGEKAEGINVFPVPFKANDADYGDGIFFTNLGDKATIIIYNLVGDLVYKKEVKGPIFKWDVKNGNGQPVHSGLYLYRVKTADKTHRGKLIVIR